MWWRYFFLSLIPPANCRNMRVDQYGGFGSRRLRLSPEVFPARWRTNPFICMACYTGHHLPQDWDCVLPNSWLMSGCEVVPTRQSARASCDVWKRGNAARVRGQQIHASQSSRLAAAILRDFLPPHTPRQNICVSIYKPDATADVCEYFIPPSQQRVVTTNIMRSLPRRREASSFAQRVVENVQLKGRRAFKWRAMNEWMNEFRLKKKSVVPDQIEFNVVI